MKDELNFTLDALQNQACTIVGNCRSVDCRAYIGADSEFENFTPSLSE